MTSVRIGVIGDYRADHETHPATTAAIRHAAVAHGRAVEVTWVPTPVPCGAAAEALAGFHAVWIAPMSPYESMQGALDAITYARVHDVPLLGTCAGFQHVVIEFARNVVGVTDAQHAEYDPDAEHLVIDALACSLAGQVMDVRVVPGSVAHRAYGRASARERYYCKFGLNPDHVGPLVDAGLVVSGTDAAGAPRIIEIPGLRFFVATLFVPQTASTPTRPHPLVAGFVRAAIDHAHERRSARV